ncbi:MAG: EscU/YscU/HrcU family type III secretion system export apparatus switch protein [Pirellulaceae bacterium]|nr:EscU/YscU/HrcU family type III secretion system export apparatus switch protein [Planctomycetales bacterium]MCA9207423.1 EscU/YscU/HrcU family type III secretion system export apparatus switch protein [Planctomycetales bacterium]
MADTDQQRSEAPTPRRRDEARKKGQFALSPDLTTGILMLVAGGCLWMMGPRLASDLMAIMRDGLLFVPRQDWGVNETTVAIDSLVWNSVGLCSALVIVMMAVGLLMGGLQTGFALSLEPLTIKWERLSPVQGWGRIYSSKSAVKAIMTLLKAVAVFAVVFWMFRGRIAEFGYAGRGTLHDTAAETWYIGLRIMLVVAIALIVIGLLDYLFQRWKHEEDLKMSRQDILDEQKQTDGDPQMKARVRKLQREMSRPRQIQEVKSASFVVRNPTHFAVALKYDGGAIGAPKVVAKGKGYWARRIIEEAEKHGVPVIERKPLARALYAAVDVGKEIPSEFYQAVIEILAYLYRLRRAS